MHRSALCAQARADLMNNPNNLTRTRELLDTYGPTDEVVDELLVALVLNGHAQALSHVLAERPDWPPHVLVSLAKAACEMTSPQEQGAALRVVLPMFQSSEHRFAPVVNQMALMFFQDTTHPNHHRWMIDTFVPSLDINKAADQDMIRYLWRQALKPCVLAAPPGPHDVSQIPVSCLIDWMTAHAAQCPPLTRMPTAAECAQARTGSGEARSPVAFLGGLLQEITPHPLANNTHRATAVLNALGKDHPTVVVWNAQHIARHYVDGATAAHNEPHQPPGTIAQHNRQSVLMEHVLERMPTSQALELGAWVCSTSPEVSPTVRALISAAEISQALQPARHAPRAQKM